MIPFLKGLHRVFAYVDAYFFLDAFMDEGNNKGEAEEEGCSSSSRPG